MIWRGPLAFAYQAATDLKNELFERKLFKNFRPRVPVISVGNLTVGGTGKTPFVDYTIRYFVQKDKQVGVVSRAYKARAQEPVQVDPNALKASEVYGDEPTWLAQQNPRARIFSGQTKWKIAEWALMQAPRAGESPLDLLILDDGFQHRRLERDLDILILDSTEKWENYQTVPAGRAREKFENIKRADLVVISKVNWTEDEKLQHLRQQVPKDKKIIETGSRIVRFHELHSGESHEPGYFAGGRALLFCSIARPEIFKKMMAGFFDEVDMLAFPDHHRFQADDIESILNKMKACGAEYLFCTEKDAVKLSELWPAHQSAQLPLWVSELELVILKNKEELHAAFDQFCT